MDWLYLLLVLGAGVAAWRIYGAIQRARAARGDDWDEMLVRNLRAQGGNNGANMRASLEAWPLTVAWIKKYAS